MPMVSAHELRFRRRYGNKADFSAVRRLFSHLKLRGLDVPSSVVLIAGANQGQSMSNILAKCPRLTVHGFEIQKGERLKALKAVRTYPGAVVHGVGWGEEAAEGIEIGGSGGGAGFYDPQGQRGWKLSGETAGTVRLDDWARGNVRDGALFVLIDTEGYEPKIIRGMGLELEENRRRFPCFQYELGGTWAARDNRHQGDQWGQEDAARHLESCGYELYLVGKDNWLPVTSEFFRTKANPHIQDEGFGPFVQGNALALHPLFAPETLCEYVHSNSRPERPGAKGSKAKRREVRRRRIRRRRRRDRK